MLLCRISTSVVYQLPKLRRRVRFPLSAYLRSPVESKVVDFTGLFYIILFPK